MFTSPFASISIPPAVVLISIAFAPVPAELIVSVCVEPPDTAIERSLFEPATVRLESSAASIVTAPVEFIS